MKIRILDNSLRLRFSQRELEELINKGRISKQINFPGGSKFIYSLIKSDKADELSADFENTEMRVLISDAKVNALAKTDLVSVECNHSGLNILVEKDFKCLTDRKEDETELFDNPLKSDPNC